ncbi:MAG: NAD(P)H-dependent oxidoreductase [Deltaproteobacteria bacterium]|nr:NAD(P)H-dependent oxidoreductase [Deltaproteobacteria bacterium]
MTTIIGIAGALRRGSYNAALLAAAAELAPEIQIATIRGIPLYDGDVEAEQGIPQVVAELKDRIAAADGVLIATPEYNNSMPGVLKNAIDWMSRPAKDIPRVWGDKAVVMIGATPGPGGTRLSQTAWLPVLRTLGTRPYFGRSLYVANAAQVFDAEGRLVDEKIRKVLGDLVAGFVKFAATR